MTDARLTARSFFELINPHLPALQRLAIRFTRRHVDAQDLVQELLARLYARSDDLGRVQSLGPWLAQSLYHLYVDQSRRPERAWPRRIRTIDEDVARSELLLAELRSGATPEFASEMERLSRSLQEAMAELPQEQRDVVILHDVEGHELQETAAIMGIAVGTAKSRLNRARTRLREYLTRRKLILANVVSGDESLRAVGLATPAVGTQ